MAIRQVPADSAPPWMDREVLVTPEAQRRMHASEIWYHLGGWYQDGDTYETQEIAFSRDLDEFWSDLVGPDESLRLRIMEAVNGITNKWAVVKIDADCRMVIEIADGAQKLVQPPKTADSAASAA